MAFRLAITSSFRQSRNIIRAVSVQLSTTCVPKAGTITTIPTDLEQSTGIERQELEAILAGNPDPFNLNITKGAVGTKEAPTLVPSMYEERIVGCVCEEESSSINWLVLKKGSPQRCPKCGNSFQLVTGKTNALED